VCNVPNRAASFHQNLIIHEFGSKSDASDNDSLMHIPKETSISMQRREEPMNNVKVCSVASVPANNAKTEQT
jgi:hypothetical protein